MDCQRIETYNLITFPQTAKEIEYSTLPNVTHGAFNGTACANCDNHIVGAAIFTLFVDEGFQIRFAGIECDHANSQFCGAGSEQTLHQFQSLFDKVSHNYKTRKIAQRHFQIEAPHCTGSNNDGHAIRFESLDHRPFGQSVILHQVRMMLLSRNSA